MGAVTKVGSVGLHEDCIEIACSKSTGALLKVLTFIPTFFFIYCCRFGDSALPSALCCRGISPISPACRIILRCATSTQWSTRRSLYLFLPCVLHGMDTHCGASCVTLTPDQTRLTCFGCTRVTVVLCGCRSLNTFLS